MSRIKSPQEKKRLEYEHGHRNASGQPPKGWRNTKPLKKAKANRSFRKATNDALQATLDEEVAAQSALRKAGSIIKEKVLDWGKVKLGSYVQMGLNRRKAAVGAKKLRRAKALKSK